MSLLKSSYFLDSRLDEQYKFELMKDNINTLVSHGYSIASSHLVPDSTSYYLLVILQKINAFSLPIPDMVCQDVNEFYSDRENKDIEFDELVNYMEENNHSDTAAFFRLYSQSFRFIIEHILGSFV